MGHIQPMSSPQHCLLHACCTAVEWPKYWGWTETPMASSGGKTLRLCETWKCGFLARGRGHGRQGREMMEGYWGRSVPCACSPGAGGCPVPAHGELQSSLRGLVAPPGGSPPERQPSRTLLQGTVPAAWVSSSWTHGAVGSAGDTTLHLPPAPAVSLLLARTWPAAGDLLQGWDTGPRLGQLACLSSLRP